MISRLVRTGIAAVLLGVFGSHAFAQTPTVRLVLDFAIQGQQSPFVLAADGGYFARAGSTSRSIAVTARPMPSPKW
jgi:ABC-type nitrate/sulfonate/bicarbonate transport system substrate-binding protein